VGIPLDEVDIVDIKGSLYSVAKPGDPNPCDERQFAGSLPYAVSGLRSRLVPPILATAQDELVRYETLSARYIGTKPSDSGSPGVNN